MRGVFRAPDSLKNTLQKTEELDEHSEDLGKPTAGQEQTADDPLETRD